MFERLVKKMAKTLKLLAIPAGLEPATTRLEGGDSSRDIKANSDIWGMNASRTSGQSLNSESSTNSPHLPDEAKVSLSPAQAWDIASDLTQDERQALKEAEWIHYARIEHPDKHFPERGSYPPTLNRLHLAYSWILLGRTSPGYPGSRHGITPKGLLVAAQLVAAPHDAPPPGIGD